MTGNVIKYGGAIIVAPSLIFQNGNGRIAKNVAIYEHIVVNCNRIMLIPNIINIFFRLFSIEIYSTLSIIAPNFLRFKSKLKYPRSI